MALAFSIPGKTFLAGEYLALQEGPTLVFLSQPCFEVRVKKGSGQLEGIHPDSPAGLFIKKHSQIFSKFDVSFRDPYQGRGGFGASTAQFLGAYAMSLVQEHSHQDMEKIFDIKHLLESYYEVAWTGEGQRPSGADLVGQLKGSLTFFEKRRSAVSKTGWPFSNLDFYIVHTGNKVPTHEHLKTLKQFDASALEKAFVRIRGSFEQHHEDEFVAGVQDYAKALVDLQFTCEATLKLLAEVKSCKGVLAAKGCGALGADVLMVVTSKGEKASLEEFCRSKKLTITASQKDLAPGLQLQVRENL